MPNESVGRTIARARKLRGLSQRELADALGVSASTVANWERGASYPLKFDVIVEEYLGITIPPREAAPEQAAS